MSTVVQKAAIIWESVKAHDSGRGSKPLVTIGLFLPLQNGQIIPGPPVTLAGQTDPDATLREQ